MYFGGAGALFLSGAFGMEVVASYPRLYESRGIPYAVIFTIEEFLELTGAAVFLCGLVDYLARRGDGLHLMIRFGHDPARRGEASSASAWRALAWGSLRSGN